MNVSGAGGYAEAAVSVSVVCHSYTHARRYPLVIGKIGGFALPTPLSPTQIATLVGVFVALLSSRRWWGAVVPGVVGLLVLVVVPGALTWSVRHLRMEGRSPIKMLFGVGSLLAAPPGGTVRGRQRWRAPRPVRVSCRVLIVGDAAADVPPYSNRVSRLAASASPGVCRWVSLVEAA